MIKIENYPKAYAEVYEILKYVDKEDLKEISKDFMDMVEKNRDTTYTFELNYNKKLEEQEVMRETKAILAYIFINYWSTEEQKRRIEQKFRQDILKDEKLKSERFSTDVFKNKKIEQSSKERKEENAYLIEYEKEKIIIKFLKKLRLFLK